MEAPMSADQTPPDGPHPLAAAARALFKELTDAGKPIEGVGVGEGRIFLRVTSEQHGAPEEYQGYPVTVLIEDGRNRA
jgi:hypothetical protein